MTNVQKKNTYTYYAVLLNEQVDANLAGDRKQEFSIMREKEQLINRVPPKYQKEIRNAGRLLAQAIRQEEIRKGFRAG